MHAPRTAPNTPAGEACRYISADEYLFRPKRASIVSTVVGVVVGCLCAAFFVQALTSTAAVSPTTVLPATWDEASPPKRWRIRSLPGVPHLPNEMYTGFIDAGTPPSGRGTMYFHYWCIMSASDKSKDPLVLWYNGGPGASSLFGLLQEFGPLLLSADSYDAAYLRTGIPTPRPNRFAWTDRHSVCAIDSPPPVGFSFCSEGGVAGDAASCGPWSDASVVEANHRAHRNLIHALPELRGNRLFFAGESYAGIYVHPARVEPAIS
jgi:hypothetical protein